MRLLDVRGLEAWYGPVQVLHGVNVRVDEGEIIALIGPNGAGKSTVLRSVVGIVRKRKGTVLFKGKDVLRCSQGELVRRGVCFVPQGRVVFSTLTVEENLEMGAFTRKEDLQKDMERVYEMFPRLKERRRQKAGLLSGGEQQMVAVGRALMVKPELLLLDEPSLGLSPRIKREVFEKVREVREDGVTVVLVEQNARMALALSDRAYVLEAGRNRLEGRGRDLLRDERVQHLYLGGVV